MSALDRLKARCNQPPNWGKYVAKVLVTDLALALAVVDAAKAMHDSAHNGNLYAKEYDALDQALSKLTEE